MNPVVEKILAGDVRSVAMLIRDLDENEKYVNEVLKELYPHTGQAYIIGVTGAPGTGKSTLVDKIISCLRQSDKTVGVLAVDPTSHISGGAILGDRIRMSRHSLDNGVFIRSLATRDTFGGLTRSTRGSIDILDAMGKDYIIVETVGVGQDEVDIAQNAHTTLVVVIPGMGDDIQAIKAGILEIGDIFVVNKADKEGADITMTELGQKISMDKQKHHKNGWLPLVLKTQALQDIGIDDLMEKIEEHRQWTLKNFKVLNLRKQKKRVESELFRMIKDSLIKKVVEKIQDTDEFEENVESVASGEANIYSVCEAMVQKRISDLKDDKNRRI